MTESYIGCNYLSYFQKIPNRLKFFQNISPCIFSYDCKKNKLFNLFLDIQSLCLFAPPMITIHIGRVLIRGDLSKHFRGRAFYMLDVGGVMTS